MSTQESSQAKFISCPNCSGQSVVKKRMSKKAKATYEYLLKKHLQDPNKHPAPETPVVTYIPCKKCRHSGILKTDEFPEPKPHIYPNIAIIGGGIGGTALAVACLHRGIPFTLYERDGSFNDRSQGYGLTLQQASKAIKGLGLEALEDGIVSTKHIVHDPFGTIKGSWGMRKWMNPLLPKSDKKTNIHIARQSLRKQLLMQLSSNCVKWAHEFDHYTNKENQVELQFKVNGELIHHTADLVIGADGIRSNVREQLIGTARSSLHYLGCMVILGICSYKDLDGLQYELLDGKTVFQTANGFERMYVMPFNKDAVMWQFSYPVDESMALGLSKKGASALKEDVSNRIKKWHAPIPQIIKATRKSLISGYPVYDRALLQTEWLINENRVTLIGDAAHPMSPFKGQGANQALIDALSLARQITKTFNNQHPFIKNTSDSRFLEPFLKEMIHRTSKKVLDSRSAVKFLHTKQVLTAENAPRKAY